MKMGFSGTRSGMTNAQHDAVLRLWRRLGVTEAHHGDCVGADADAHSIAVDVLGIQVRIHPPKDDKLRAYMQEAAAWAPPRGYLERDRDIVDETDALTACPGEDTPKPRSGTWYTIGYARRAHKKVYLVKQDGTVEES